MKGTRGSLRDDEISTVSEKVFSEKYTFAPKSARKGSSSLLREKEGHDEGPKCGFGASFYGAKRRHFRARSSKFGEDGVTFVTTLLLYNTLRVKLSFRVEQATLVRVP